MPSRLCLLGPVSLTGPDGACARRASQQRRVALLALIASAPGGAITRDRLLGLLWPDRDERMARHLLADSLYVLRRTLGDSAIVATADSVRLSPDLVWTDVAEFRRALDDERCVGREHDVRPKLTRYAQRLDSISGRANVHTVHR